MKALAVSRHCELPHVADTTADRDLGEKSAVRAVQILGFFAQIQREARVNKLVKCFGFPQSPGVAQGESAIPSRWLIS